MAFVSLKFIIFIAVVFAAYFIIPVKYRWLVLLAGSLAFYYLNSGLLLFVMAATAIITWGIGLWIDRIYRQETKYLSENEEYLSDRKELKKAVQKRSKSRAKFVMILGVVVSLLPLLYLKYGSFFLSILSGSNTAAGAVSGTSSNALYGWLRALGSRFSSKSLHMDNAGLLLPIGISFYTLQAISYVVDLYHRKTKADRNPLKFLLFMSFFPQIVQGPIPRHSKLATQLYEGHKFDYHRLCMGVQLILWGFMKKMIVADRISGPVIEIFDHYDKYTGLMIFLAAAMYGIQVYTDFSGGMDIARGVAQVLGIELDLNFRQPYFASSVEDFWRRWHITLGGWMREYVFYPLSLSKGLVKLGRKSRKIFGQYVGKRLPAFLAMFVVYLLVGFWHGAEWKYVVYGIWNGVFIMAGILLGDVYARGKKLCGITDEQFSWRLFQKIRTFAIVSVGRILSRADTVHESIEMLKLIPKKWYNLAFVVDGSLIDLGLDNDNWILLGIAVIVLFIVDLLHERNVSIREAIAKQNIVFRWLIYYAAFAALLIFGIYGPGYDAAGFIYEKF